MPNHFHFLIRVRDESHLSGFENLTGVDKKIAQTFSNLFNAYAKAYNKQYERRGSLFNRPFKYKVIDSDSYLSAIIVYIHRNPIHHGFCQKISDWSYSSYEVFLSSKPSKVKREDVLDWFQGEEAFTDVHKYEVSLPDNSLLIDF